MTLDAGQSVSIVGLMRSTAATTLRTGTAGTLREAVLSPCAQLHLDSREQYVAIQANKPGTPGFSW